MSIQYFNADHAVRIVATAIGIDAERDHPYSLQTADGIKIDLSATGYIQSDEPEAPDHVSFKLDFSSSQSDLFVLCLYTGLDADCDQSDPGLWRFYILRADDVTDQMRRLGLVTLPVLDGMNFVPCGHDELSAAFRTAVAQ